MKFNFDHVKDIYEVPCAKLLNGEKAIRVWKGYNGQKWARVSFSEELSALYRYSARKGLWELWSRAYGEEEVEVF